MGLGMRKEKKKKVKRGGSSQKGGDRTHPKYVSFIGRRYSERKRQEILETMEKNLDL